MVSHLTLPNAEYWARRMEITNNALLDRGFAYTQNLEEQFNRAIAGVEKDIAVWYQRFADNNAISYAQAQKWLTKSELKEFRWSVEEFIKKAEESALDGRWVKELENASARVHISRLDALKLQLQQKAELLHGGQLDGLDAHLRRTYLERYYTTAFEVQKGIGTGWTVHDLSTNVVDRVLARPWTADMQTFRDRVWTNKQALVNTVNTHLTQMILRGEAPQKTIAALAHDMGVSKAKAGRLIMTESAYFSAAAQKDCFNSLGVEEYVIVATLDSSTSEVCRDMDGKVLKMSEYTVGLTAPPFHPWCRTVTAPYFEDMRELGQRARRDPETGSTVADIPRDMTYRDWQAKFMGEVTRPASSGIMEEMKLKNKPITSNSLKDVTLLETTLFQGTKALELQQKHQGLLELVRDEPLGTEAIAYYDMQLNLLARHIGGMNRVSGTDVSGLHIAIHNHPSGTTFTHQDILNFIKSDSMQLLTAVGNDGHVYAIEKLKNYTRDSFRQAFQTEVLTNPALMRSANDYLSVIDSFLGKGGKYSVRYYK